MVFLLNLSFPKMLLDLFSIMYPLKQDKAPYVAKAVSKKSEYVKTMQQYNMKLVLKILSFALTFFLLSSSFVCQIM